VALTKKRSGKLGGYELINRLTGPHHPPDRLLLNAKKNEDFTGKTLKEKKCEIDLSPEKLNDSLSLQYKFGSRGQFPSREEGNARKGVGVLKSTAPLGGPYGSRLQKALPIHCVLKGNLGEFRTMKEECKKGGGRKASIEKRNEEENTGLAKPHLLHQTNI